MASAHTLYAVLTGDLVDWSRLPVDVRTSSIGHIRAAAEALDEIWPGIVVGALDTFRGDGWQLVLGEPGRSLRASVFMRAALRMESPTTNTLDTRVSIGIGRVESMVPERISESFGEAFSLSGRGLDALSGVRLAVAVEDGLVPRCDWVGQAVAPVLDSVIQGWTAVESRAVYGALRGWTQQEAADWWAGRHPDNRPTTRQAVADSLGRASWSAVDGTLMYVEARLSEISEPSTDWQASELALD